MREGFIAGEGLRIVIPSLILSLLLFSLGLIILASVVSLFFLFCLYFFRNPKRRSSAGREYLISPADGKVLEVREVAEDEFLKGAARRIVIFMSPADVHVNRAPCDGRIVRVEHRKGEFALAFRKDIDKENERNYILLERDHERFLVVQIAGFLARRIVSYVREGQTVRRGDPVGMIAFGSRVDLYVPPGYEIMVSLHEKVRAGVTPLARKEGER